MNDYLKLEIATEVAWQVGDILGQRPRAESRWNICDITKRIIASGIVDENSEDIDELIGGWLTLNVEGFQK